VDSLLKRDKDAIYRQAVKHRNGVIN